MHAFHTLLLAILPRLYIQWSLLSSPWSKSLQAQLGLPSNPLQRKLSQNAVRDRLLWQKALRLSKPASCLINESQHCTFGLEGLHRGLSRSGECCASPPEDIIRLQLRQITGYIFEHCSALMTL